MIEKAEGYLSTIFLWKVKSISSINVVPVSLDVSSEHWTKDFGASSENRIDKFIIPSLSSFVVNLISAPI